MRILKKIVCLAIVLAVLGCLVACNKDNNEVQYPSQHTYEVETMSNDKVLAFTPKDATPTRGLIFFVGTAIDPRYYTYLGHALAQKGYFVAIPNILFAYMFYEYDPSSPDTLTSEALALSLIMQNTSIRFFVGGHSQGGGAALRFAMEHAQIVSGAVLLAPLCFENQLLDEDGGYVLDENGETVKIKDSIADTNLPALLLQADNDHILPAQQLQEAPNRLPKTAQIHTLQNASHMAFSSSSANIGGALSQMMPGSIPDGTNANGEAQTEQQAELQRQQTVELVLAFLDALAQG